MPRIRRLHRLAPVAILSLALLPSFQGRAPASPSQPQAGERQAIPARAFLAGLGVNAHISWPGHYPYADTEQVLVAMRYLGLSNLRDHINASTLPAFDRLAAGGVRFNLLLHPKVEVDTLITWASELARLHPGSVAALEGPNEVDKWPVELDGLTGLPAAATAQRALYAKAKADPVLARVPVYNLTVSGISRSNSAALGDLSAAADYANAHPYYRSGQQSWGYSLKDPRYTLDGYIAAAQWTAPARPAVITETGSTTALQSPIGVDEAVQAKQILNSLMSAARRKAAAVYIYELADSHDNGPDDPESHYGLFRYDWTPKPAAHALHNLTRILRAPHGPTADQPPPAYTLTGLPVHGASLLFRKDDGSYDIVVWAEPDIWDEAQRRPIQAPSAAVQVSFGRSYRQIALYDPLVSDQPLQRFGPVSAVTVHLTDHPLIIELGAAD